MDTLEKLPRIIILNFIFLAFFTITQNFVYSQNTSANLPKNAHLSIYGTGWDCDIGYREIDNICEAIDLPENAYFTGSDFGRGWVPPDAVSTGRLAARAEPDPSSTDPCIVPEEAGYRRLENQLYRVEIHDRRPIALLIAAGGDRIERHRIGGRRGLGLLSQHAGHTAMDGRQRLPARRRLLPTGATAPSSRGWGKL